MTISTRIPDTLAALEMITEIALMFDDDGIDLYFINQSELNTKNVNNINTCKNIMQHNKWSGSTYAGKTMEKIVADFASKYHLTQGKKDATVIYIGDGDIHDRDVFTTAIVNGCRIPSKTNKSKPLTFQLYQVGDDANASRFFSGLDNELKNMYQLKHDCVDTVNHEKMVAERKTLSEFVLKTLIGSIDDEIDNSS